MKNIKINGNFLNEELPLEVVNMGLSLGEKICLDFNGYLKDLEKEGRCVSVHFEIQSLNLKNIGKFTDTHIEFAKVNILHGNIGSGKTTIVQSIAGISGTQRLLKDEQDSGEINLTACDGRQYHLDVFDSNDVLCVTLDGGGEMLDKKHYNDFLHYLRDLNIQLILTIENMDNELRESISRTFPHCKFIQLN